MNRIRGRVIRATPISSERLESEPIQSNDGLGSWGDAAAAGDLSSLIPEAVRPHLVLVTPLGTTIIDPTISAQDSNTQAMLSNLGIQVHVIFGPIPPEMLAAAEDAPLGRNLALLGIAVLGGLLLLARR